MGKPVTVNEVRVPSDPLLRRSLDPVLVPTYIHHSVTGVPLASHRKVTTEPGSVEPGAGDVIVGSLPPEELIAAV